MLRLMFLACLAAFLGALAPGLAVRAQPAAQGGGSAPAAGAATQVVSPDDARRALEVRLRHAGGDCREIELG